MQFNKFTLYPQAIMPELQNNSEEIAIKKLLADFENFNTQEDVKEYLRNTYKINDSIKHFYLCGNCSLDITENIQKYSVKIFTGNQDNKECIIYSFLK